MLFNEPKLLKFDPALQTLQRRPGFSALQRAEIAEINSNSADGCRPRSRFSALQRAEIAEILREPQKIDDVARFSALQRAEIAEIKEAVALVEVWQRFQCSSTSRNC